ncbi:MAG: PorT family protein [Brumimicrobium sp.]|nr:PorT family protein [Brumimicrobium sp.]MCO5268822.1 PorT family protein [Brumimicrobium sp.]
MIKKGLYIFVVFILGSNLLYSQKNPKTLNYSKFDNKWVHFGFMLGANTADFTTRYKPNMLDKYNTYSITNKMQPGFDLGLISSVKLGTPILRLRFIPSLSFIERVLTYTYLSDEPDKKFETKDERIGSTNLDFPLLLQFRTLRYNNFTAYVVAGAQYTLDLQSKEKSAQKFSDPFLKLYKNDFQGQVGAGVEFFLVFFKFGIELKFSHGFKNNLFQDNTRISTPIDKLYNRVWWISFTFEG